MKLRELLQQMKATQEEIGASEPYICGGTPRDRYLGNLQNIADLDFTTGDKTIQYLSQEFGQRLAKKYNIVIQNHNDGHSTMTLGKFKMDFSSNFIVEGIDAILAKLEITKATEMQKEMFSRDFTCNSLILGLDLRTIHDPTNRAFKDLDNKIIKTCLDPAITLNSSKNRVVRAIYLSSKLGFEIDDSIIQYVQKNPQSIQVATAKGMVEKLHQAFDKDPEKAAYNISKMGVWDKIPIIEPAKPYYEKRNTKVAYFQGGGGVNEPTPKKKKYKSEPAIVNQTRFKEPFYRNYDLYDIPGFEHIGPGAGWHSMQKYKSISEFLKAKRKKMKDKYKADDSWIDESGEITKKNPNIESRAILLTTMVKVADENDIDFPIDDQVTSENWGGPQGLRELLMPEEDFEGKKQPSLNFGRDYVEDEEAIDEDYLDAFIEKYLSHEPHSDLYGLPDGLEHSNEEDLKYEEINPDYGTLGPESLMYEDKWNI
jgi:tRNA nucleotidyltransferase/poly(A) polymerase